MGGNTYVEKLSPFITMQHPTTFSGKEGSADIKNSRVAAQNLQDVCRPPPLQKKKKLEAISGISGTDWSHC